MVTGHVGGGISVPLASIDDFAYRIAATACATTLQIQSDRQIQSDSGEGDLVRKTQ